MKKFLSGILCGAILVLLAGTILMPQFGKLFFVEDSSRFSYEETISKVRKQCDADLGWHIIQVKDFNKAYLKKGMGELPFRLTEFKVGNPDHSYRVNKEFPAVSTFMPAAIAIVEYEPGDVRIYRKNTGLMGRMFTGSVKQVMQYEVPQELDRILSDIIEKN